MQPITFETERLKIHSFQISDIENHQQLAKDMLTLFSDPFTLKFVPEKLLHNIKEAEDFVKTMIINHHLGKNHLYFITYKELGQVIGIIDFITPKVIKEHYSLQEYPYFIEFYLLEQFSAQTFMTEIIPAMVTAAHNLGIMEIGAVVNRANISAIKVLKKANFIFKDRFDVAQDLYLAKAFMSE